MIFWPTIDEVLNLPVLQEEQVWPEGPSLGVLLKALRPALRALFLQGWRTDVIDFSAFDAPATGYSFRCFDTEAFELFDANRAYETTAGALDIVFETSPINDLSGPADAGYAIAEAEYRIQFGGPFEETEDVPQALQDEIDRFVEGAIARLTPLAQQNPLPRANGQGMLWIFDPAQFGGISEPNTLPAGVFVDELNRRPALILEEQIKDQRLERDPAYPADLSSPPSLAWVADYAPYFGNMLFFDGLRTSLEARGQSHFLTMGTLDRLSAEGGPSWLDVILELVALGVIDLSGLLEPVPPVDPIAAQQTSDGLELLVWGESTIKVRRRTPARKTRAEGGYHTGLDGCVSWDYASPPGDRPRVVVVAARGIEIAPPDAVETFPWLLDLYRTQSESLVPGAGESIDTSSFLGGAAIPPRGDEVLTSDQAERVVAATNKADGVILEFPSNVRGDRFRLDLTVDPRSGTDGYAIDVHYYGYTPTARGGATGVHFSVWATPGVVIETNGTALVDGQSPGTLYFFLGWAVTCELWQVPTVRHLPHPFSEILPITERYAWKPELIPASVPRFPANGAPSYTTEGNLITLAPKAFSLKAFEDSLVYDFIDVVIGFIPFVGDVAQCAEVVIALSTGMDKWGRPVTQYQLAWMTLCAVLPFVSTSMLEGAGEAANGGLFQDFNGVALRDFVRAAEIDGFGSRQLAEAAVAETNAWQFARLSADRREEAIQGMLDFAVANQDLIRAWSRQLCDATNELWLQLDDVFDGTGFRVSVLDAPYQRWLSEGNPPDPRLFLVQSGTKTAEKKVAAIVAQALLGSAEGSLYGVRMVPRDLRYPSHAGWLPFTGPSEHVSNIDRVAGALDLLRTQVSDFLTGALHPESRIAFVDAGMLRSPRMYESDRSFVERAADRLLQEIEESGAASVVGNDLVQGDQMPLAERAARLVVALFAATSEMRTRGLNLTALLDEERFPELLEFVRSFIIRKGYESGLRFELASAAWFFEHLEDVERHPAFIDFRTQLQLPQASGLGSASGPDGVLYLGIGGKVRAAFVQMKAFIDLSQLAFGHVTFWLDRDGLLNVAKNAPEFIRQPLSDALRVGRLNNLIEGTSKTATSVEVGNVHLLLFDDVYLRDAFYRLASEAKERTGKAVIVASDIELNVSPQSRVDVDAVRDMFAAMFPSGLDMGLSREHIAQLYQSDQFLMNWALRAEAWINDLMEEDFELIAGRKLRFVVRPGNTERRDLIDAVVAAQQALDAEGGAP